MLRLILDSSTDVASAVLADRERVIVHRSAKGKTLSLLQSVVAETLAEVGAVPGDLSDIGVVRGPGSWTGLHVCVTAAKTMVQVLGIPLIPLSMLDALVEAAADLSKSDGVVVPLIDAKHGAVYTAAYETRGNTTRIVLPPAKRSISELVEFLRVVQGQLTVTGPAARLYAPDLSTEHPETFAVLDIDYPTPDAFARLTHRKSSQAIGGEAIYSLEPDYMQEDFTVAPKTGGPK
jgi:tRNA threonylcarbamoyl adenosine modification protein YeaZ